MSNQEVTEVLQTCPQRVKTGGPRHGEAQAAQEQEGAMAESAAVEEPGSNLLLEPSERYGDVGMEALPAMTTQEIRAGQKEDPDIAPILHFKSRNQKPNHSERMDVAVSGRLLLKEWRRLVVRRGILYRRVRDCQKGVVEQLILPQKLRAAVKTALHDEAGLQTIR